MVSGLHLEHGASFNSCNAFQAAIEQLCLRENTALAPQTLAKLAVVASACPTCRCSKTDELFEKAIEKLVQPLDFQTIGSVIKGASDGQRMATRMIHWGIDWCTNRSTLEDSIWAITLRCGHETFNEEDRKMFSSVHKRVLHMPQFRPNRKDGQHRSEGL